MLEKKISLLSGVAIAISMVVGSGLFGLPGLAIKETDPLTSLAGWFLIVFLMPALIYVFSWLGQRYPSSEGVSLYAVMGLGEWSKKGVALVTCGTLIVGMPAFFLVGGSYITKLLELQSFWVTPCALLLALGTTVINLIGVDKLGAINKLIVVLVLAMVLYVSLLSLPFIPNAFMNISANDFGNIEFGKLWLAMSIIFWAFQGWENMTFGFEEIKNPRKNIPLIYWISFALVSLIYLVFAISIFAAAQNGFDVSGLSGVSSILPDNILGKIVLIIMVTVLIANANSWVFGSSRAFFSSAKNGVLPKILGVTNKKGIPVYALICALIGYTLIICLMQFFGIEEKYAFLLTTQGFILLYGGAIVAFFKHSTGIFSRFIAIIASVTWVFLMQGFGLLILYPLSLMLLGYLAYRYDTFKNSGNEVENV